MQRVIGLLLLNCCSLAAAQTLTPEVRQFVTVDAPVVALTHVRVIDGTGAAAREDQTIILNKGKDRIGGRCCGGEGAQRRESARSAGMQRDSRAGWNA